MSRWLFYLQYVNQMRMQDPQNYNIPQDDDDDEDDDDDDDDEDDDENIGRVQNVVTKNNSPSFDRVLSTL